MRILMIGLIVLLAASIRWSPEYRPVSFSVPPAPLGTYKVQQGERTMSCGLEGFEGRTTSVIYGPDSAAEVALIARTTSGWRVVERRTPQPKSRLRWLN